jgi:hypothetical protein
MVSPLRLTDDINIQIMSASDQTWFEHQILTQFASSDTGVGTVSVNPADTTGLTLIGSFVDTERQNSIGSHPVGTNVNTVTYNFYQDLRDEYDYSSDHEKLLSVNASNDLQVQSSDDIKTGIALSTAQNLVNSGLGMYKLQATAPTGGTWTVKATIIDATVSGDTTYYLWRKTEAESTPTQRDPLKLTTTNDIQVMTVEEQKAFNSALGNQIVQDGVGQYKLQENSPTSGGTWIAAGSAISDQRHDVANVNYVGSSSVSYTGFYTGTYTGGSFTGYYVGFFAGSYTGTAPFSGAVTGFFAGQRAYFFAGTYTGSYTGTYTFIRGQSFTGYFSGLTVQNSISTISSKTLWVRTA